MILTPRADTRTLKGTGLCNDVMMLNVDEHRSIPHTLGLHMSHMEDEKL